MAPRKEKPGASAARSAAAIGGAAGGLGGGAGFGGWSGSRRVAEAEPAEEGGGGAEGGGAEALGNAAVHLRALAKRDATTKLKALAALRGAWAEGNAAAAAAAAALPVYVAAYRRLVHDPSRHVRVAAADALGALCCAAGKALAKHLRTLSAAWWPAQFDPDAEAAAAAQRAFESVFTTPQKRRDALVHCRDAVCDALAESVGCASPADLAAKAALRMEKEELLDAHTRMVSSALRALAALVETLVGGGADADGAVGERVGALVSSHGCLKPFVTSKVLPVRQAAYAALRTLAVHAPAAVEPKLAAASALVFGSLADRDAPAHPEMLDLVLAFTRAFPGCWETVNARKAVLPRLRDLFRNAFFGSASTSASSALPLLAALPAELASSPDGLLTDLLGALWAGWEGCSNDGEGRRALLAAYRECAVYVPLRSGQCAPDDASFAALQTGALLDGLLERPFAAILDGSRKLAEREELAGLVVHVVSTLAGKASASAAALDTFWSAAAERVASAIAADAAAVPAVVALIRRLRELEQPALHPARAAYESEWVIDRAIRPIVARTLEQLRAAAAACIQVVAASVQAFGPGSLAGGATGDGAPNGAGALVDWCLSDSSPAATRAELLVALLQWSEDASRATVVERLVPRETMDAAAAGASAELLLAVVQHIHSRGMTAGEIEVWRGQWIEDAASTALAGLGAEDWAVPVLCALLDSPRADAHLLRPEGIRDVLSGLHARIAVEGSEIDERARAAAFAALDAAADFVFSTPLPDGAEGARLDVLEEIFAMQMLVDDAGQGIDELCERARQAWAEGSGRLADSLPFSAAAALLAKVATLVRQYVAAAPGAEDSSTHAARRLSEAVGGACASRDHALSATLGPLLESHGDWPRWARVPASDSTSKAAVVTAELEDVSDDWPERMADFVAALLDELGADSLMTRGGSSRPWLAVELLCALENVEAVHAALQCAADERVLSEVFRLLVGLAEHGKDDTSVPTEALAELLQVLVDGSEWDAEDHAEFFITYVAPFCPPGVTEPGAELAEAVLPILVPHLRAAEPIPELMSFTKTWAAEAARCIRGQGCVPGAVALRVASACFSGEVSTACVIDEERAALLDLWRAVGGAEASNAAARAAAARAGGAGGGIGAVHDDMERELSVAALASVVVDFGWARLETADWTLLVSHARRWLGAALAAAEAAVEVAAAAADPSGAKEEAWAELSSADLEGLPRLALLLLQTVEALPLEILEPDDAGRGGDVVPYSAVPGAPEAAKALGTARWPSVRREIFEDVLRLLWCAGALVSSCGAPVVCARHAGFWTALGELARSAPERASAAAAAAADAWREDSGVGAIEAMYKLLGARGAGMHSLQRAASAVLHTRPLQRAAVLGLDGDVADVAELEAIAEQRAEGGDDVATADHASAAVRACARVELALVIQAGSSATFGARLAWGVLLGAMLSFEPTSASRRRLAQFIRDTEALPAFLTTLLDRLPLPSAKGEAPAEAVAAWAAAAEPAKALAAADTGDDGALAAALFGACLRALPAATRLWFADLRDRGRAAALESATAAFASGRLISAELAKVEASGRSGCLTVKASRATRAVHATYELDESSLELTVKMPSSYPLRAAECEVTKRVGIPEGRMRKWLLAVSALLRTQNGAVSDALGVWAANVEREFDGVEPCPICYACLHATTHQLPKLACRQCRNKFHSACLYQWFQSSNKSSCPVCQTPWGQSYRSSEPSHTPPPPQQDHEQQQQPRQPAPPPPAYQAYDLADLEDDP